MPHRAKQESKPHLPAGKTACSFVVQCTPQTSHHTLAIDASCATQKDAKCFLETLTLVKEKINPRAPCTKLEYRVKTVGPYKHTSDGASFKIILTKPYISIVNEEYLIFDAVAMISAIGGTLGLCIGFSFMDFAAVLAGSMWMVKNFCKKKQSIVSMEPTLKKQNNHEPDGLAHSNAQFELQVTKHMSNLEEEIQRQAKEITKLKEQVNQQIRVQ